MTINTASGLKGFLRSKPEAGGEAMPHLEVHDLGGAMVGALLAILHLMHLHHQPGLDPYGAELLWQYKAGCSNNSFLKCSQ